MRRSMSRHFGFLGGDGVTAMLALGPGVPRKPPPEFYAQDYITYLLYIDAEIEHSLMIQYLYAAYSLGGPQVPEKYRAQVRGWQEIIFGVAKEEMGHLICVQNVLRLIGAPLNLSREDYPWDSPFYPFKFYLEPLSVKSLAKYVFVEAPVDWTGDDAEEIKRLLPTKPSNPHQVAVLFKLLIELVKDPQFLPDHAFQSDTWPMQAKFDEWGRGYAGGRRGNTEGANPGGAPNVLVMPAAGRDEAVQALTEIAEQGESNTDPAATSPSHFQRFLKVYKEMRDLLPIAQKEQWSPTRPVAVNPYLAPENLGDISAPAAGDTTLITHPEARAWGHLFNIRYRMLLHFLMHSFELTDKVKGSAVESMRGTVIMSAFGEMYNMRAIANIMVQTPLSEGRDGFMAGPTFEMPYTLTLPIGLANRWRLHRKLLDSAAAVIQDLLKITASSRHGGLHAMLDADRNQMDLFDAILAAIR